jgi:ATP-binding cassette, subfamily G (WHITE), member 2, PDR
MSLLGSVFYNLPDNTDSFFSRGALLFFAILMNAFASGLEASVPSSHVAILSVH